MKDSKKTSNKQTSSKDNGSNEKPLYNPNVTGHDKDIVSQKNIHGDGGDDQQLRDRKKKVDFAGKNLDVPGSEKAKKSNTGLRDEENQLFSQGGDDKDNLEEDKPEI